MRRTSRRRRRATRRRAATVRRPRRRGQRCHRRRLKKSRLGGAAAITAKRAREAAEAAVDGRRRHRGDGIARFLRLTVAGWYKVSVEVDSVKLRPPDGEWPLLVRPSAPHGGLSEISDAKQLRAKEWPANERVAATLLLRDAYGNLTSGGEALTARVVDGGGGVDEAVAVPYTRGVMPRDGLVVHDGGDGAYELRCVPKGIGLASLELRLADGSALRGTPLSLTVVPGRAAARCCYAVDGVRRVAAGCPAELRVVACDASGNRLLVASPPGAARAGQPGQEVAVRDAGDGSYVVTRRALRWQAHAGGLPGQQGDQGVAVRDRSAPGAVG